MDGPIREQRDLECEWTSINMIMIMDLIPLNCVAVICVCGVHVCINLHTCTITLHLYRTCIHCTYAFVCPLCQQVHLTDTNLLYIHVVAVPD